MQQPLLQSIRLPWSCTGSHRDRRPALGFPRYSRWGSNENNTPVTQSNNHLLTQIMTKMLAFPSLNETWQYHSENSTYNALKQGRHPAPEVQRTQEAESMLQV